MNRSWTGLPDNEPKIATSPTYQSARPTDKRRRCRRGNPRSTILREIPTQQPELPWAVIFLLRVKTECLIMAAIVGAQDQVRVSGSPAHEAIHLVNRGGADCGRIFRSAWRRPGLEAEVRQQTGKS